MNTSRMKDVTLTCCAMWQSFHVELSPGIMKEIRFKLRLEKWAKAKTCYSSFGKVSESDAQR